MPTCALVSVLVAAALGAAPNTKVALLPVPVGAGMDDKVAAALSDATAAALHKLPGVQLVTQQDMSALLGFEKQKALVGCQTDGCVAEIAGALGVDRVVITSISKLGDSWLIAMRLVDTKKAVPINTSDRRLRNGSLDDVLDALPKMVHELFAAERPPAPDAGAPSTASASADKPAADKPAPEKQAPEKPAGDKAAADKPDNSAADQKAKLAHIRSGVEEPVAEDIVAGVRPKLHLATDAKQRIYVTYLENNEVGGDEGLFAGDGKILFRQVLPLRAGEGKTFEYYFWEPRADAAGKGMFARTADGKLELVCGKTHVPMKVVPDADAKKILDKASFDRPRWRRSVRVVARDEATDTWYVADQPPHRKDENQAKHMRLFIVNKGQVQAYAVTDFVKDALGGRYTTDAGKLKIMPAGKATTAEWTSEGKTTKLTWMPVDSALQAIHTTLGIYAGEKLGTACDPFF